MTENINLQPAASGPADCRIRLEIQAWSVVINVTSKAGVREGCLCTSVSISNWVSVFVGRVNFRQERGCDLSIAEELLAVKLPCGMPCEPRGC